MPLDVGRISHLLEQMHRSEDDAGDPIDAGKHLVTDGARGFTWEDAGGSGTDLGWFFVTAYGAAGDGTTDDTTAIQDTIDAAAAAGGGVIYFPPGEYVISGALQDTGAFNAQLLLPDVATSSTQITLTFLGPVRAPMHPIGPSPDETGPYAILRSTLTGASGTAAVVSGGNGSFLTGDENNIQVNIYNLICLSPDNPTMSWWNIEMTQGGERGALLISVVPWSTASQPTHSNSYGIKLPALGNSNASIAWGDIMVGGHYTGIKQGELCDGVYVTGLCYIGVELPTIYHPSAIRSLQQTLCTYGIKVTGAHQCDIGLHAMERDTSPAWAQIVYDIDDPSNLMRGHVRWASIVGATAVYDHVYITNGAANVSHEEIGELPDAGSIQGVTISGTPSVGYVPTATSSSAATWQAQSGGAAGHYEVIVSGTAPPVAVTNVAEDDWVYGFVPD